MARLTCPMCGSPHVELWDNDVNYNTKVKTTLNLNPLKPFTLTNTKVVKKEKKSAAKIGLAMMTGGASAMFIGTTKKKHNQYHCFNCGNVWIGK